MIFGKKKKAPPAAHGQPASRHYDVILSPVITEKSTMGGEKGKFVFNVRRDADKVEVKQAVESIFGVKVEKVNTLNRQGKIKRFRDSYGRQSDRKMAVVTLAAGQSIDLTTGVQ